jgi:hypothetical protein
MMPITTPETEKLFASYSSSLEVKEAAKAALALLAKASNDSRELADGLREDLDRTIAQVQSLLGAASEAVARLRPTRIEDRGYSAETREVAAFGRACGGCGENCGSCNKP